MIISIATDIRDVLDETLDKEFKRRKPMHRRDEVKKSKKDSSTEEQDDENDKLADLAEERGSPAPLPLDDEDFSDEGMEPLKKKAAKKKKAKKK